MTSLNNSAKMLRLLSEPTRLRLLALLATEQLSVAEITTVTGLSQSRVSTHLGRLRTAGLVAGDRLGNATLYSVNPGNFNPEQQQLWGVLAQNIKDTLVQQDRERAAEVVRQRQHRHTWAESVAGRMERQYSPGRTWEATARAIIGLLELGRVLDIASGDGVLAELLAGHADKVSCLDNSPTVIRAARKRLRDHANVDFSEGDMHALPFADAQFDQVFLMHALPYSKRPQKVLGEAARVVRTGGSLVVSTIRQHNHTSTIAPYDHVNLGFAADTLADWARDAGLHVAMSQVTSRELQPPYFEVITLIAQRLQ